ncbi:uncharacterized protein K452DRAFT_275786 [Aplosporella prunicola CBS 121167]|uniref:Solute carrier family 40 member n=1 Tax=Aplosporella prunicola CBS 121167 TaxID=1176127 RepID=A0A6A6B867_9PEZI|nr:uncharacterized protein K452DRAFT_275786 [Aplosporella prunicola CBS 121167]KAF2139465.1 hypothetical protein K452DRAFT_275786 [Aplosporella prunicola CBS 121167]
MPSNKALRSQSPLLSNPTVPSNVSSAGATDEHLEEPDTVVEVIPLGIRKKLYISHFLSTWNSRVFEFGAVLYLASIFEGTLLPMSIYALARGISAILFSPTIGRYIDTSDRIQVVRLSIVLQRLVVAGSCVIFWFLAGDWQWVRTSMPFILAVLVVLACIEKLCAILNMVSVERDWVVVIANQNDSSLRMLNAQMRRIDLFCKLAGPLFISLIDGISTEVAILINMGMNVASIAVEYYAIARVYKSVPALQEPRPSRNANELEADERRTVYNTKHFMDTARVTLRGHIAYIRHRAFLPSFAGTLLYLTVLSFGGQMVTYLISAGYNSMHIGVARAVSVAFELSSTWITPKVMSWIGPIRTGIWFVNWQALCLAAGVAAFWTIASPLLSASALVGGTILSRVGLWGFDLSTQIIIQEEVEAENRGSFSSIETSWQNVFELCSYVATIVFSKPEQFRWPVLISFLAVSTAGSLYACFVRSRRGHLFHLSPCIERKMHSPAQEYERIVEPRIP